MQQLRPYQIKAVSEILALLQRGESGVMLDSPVGSGKTTIGSELVYEVAKGGLKVGWFTHRQELRFQAIERLREFGLQPAEIAPGLRHDHDALLHVASIDTVRARFADLRLWLADLDIVILDEAHHSASASWQAIMEAAASAQFIGMSATPFRLDGKGLGQSGHFTSIVRCPGVRELTKAGYLADAIVYAPPTDLDLSNVKRRGGDYALDQMAAAVDLAQLSIIGRRWYAKHCPGQAAIVFCPTVELAEKAAAIYREAGWRATSVDGKMSDQQRHDAIYGLEDGSVQVLTSCSLVGEGLDIPEVAVSIWERPTELTGLYTQMGGRALRVHPDKTNAVFLDLVGNVARHGMYDEPRQWTLNGGVKKRERDVASTWRCRNCYRVWSVPDQSKVMSCDCGHHQRIKGMPTPKQVELGPLNGVSADEISEMKLIDAIKLCDGLRDFEHLGKIKGYARGWAFNAYTRSKSFAIAKWKAKKDLERTQSGRR